MPTPAFARGKLSVGAHIGTGWKPVLPGRHSTVTDQSNATWTPPGSEGLAGTGLIDPVGRASCLSQENESPHLSAMGSADFQSATLNVPRFRKAERTYSCSKLALGVMSLTASLVVTLTNACHAFENPQWDVIVLRNGEITNGIIIEENVELVKVKLYDWSIKVIRQEDIAERKRLIIPNHLRDAFAWAQPESEQSYETKRLQRMVRGTYRITMRDLGLNDMDPGDRFYVEAVYPFDSNPIEYMITGKSEYDQIFYNTACLLGSIRFAKLLLKEIKNGNTDILVKLSISPGRSPAIDTTSPIYEFIMKSLPESTEKAKAIFVNSKDLLKSLKSDFKEESIIDLYKISAAFAKSVKNLKSIIKELPELINQLRFLRVQSESEK